MASLWRVSYHSSHSTGVDLVNVFHFVYRPASVGGGDTDAADVRDALHSALTTKYRAILPNTVQVLALSVAEVLTPGSTDVPDAASQTINSPGSITPSGDQLPVPLCTLYTLYTNAAIRSGHGRVFLPNGGNASILASNSLWDTTSTYFTTTVKALLDELLADHTSNSPGNVAGHLSLVVYSRTRHAAADSDYYFDVTSYALRPAPHWLRSRMTAP